MLMYQNVKSIARQWLENQKCVTLQCPIGGTAASLHGRCIDGSDNSAHFTDMPI